MATTVITLIDKVLRRLEENTDAPVFYTRAEVLSYLNEMYTEFQLITHKVVDTKSLTLTTGNWYTVPDGSLAVLDMKVGDRELERSSLEDLDREDTLWETKSKVTVRKWCPIGLNLLAVVPPPSESVVASLTVLKAHSDMTESDTVDLEDEYVDALEEGMFHLCRFKEGGKEFQGALGGYDSFQKKAGLVLVRLEDLRDDRPDQDTGQDYSTVTPDGS